MNRELTGVIACMQEIQIACARLKEIENLRGLEYLTPIMEKARTFFGSPSQDSAEEVLELIRQCPYPALLNFVVTVDKISTTLTRLSQELAETLEDL